MYYLACKLEREICAKIQIYASTSINVNLLDEAQVAGQHVSGNVDDDRVGDHIRLHTRHPEGINVIPK